MSIVQSPRPPLFVAEQGNPRKSDPRFVRGVSTNGRYLVDQAGVPILLRGDSPWSLMANLSASEVDTYLAAKKGLGINCLIVSLIGAPENGGPATTGATFDGVLPFNSGDVTSFNGPYWVRIDQYLEKIRAAGMTAFLYPIDGWTTLSGNIFNGKSNANCQTYGQQVATRLAKHPHIVWMFGGDYTSDNGGTIDQQFNACITGIRDTGDSRIVSLQGGADSLTSGSTAYWSTRGDFNFCYSYHSTYESVLSGYAASWNTSQGKPATRPAFFGEGEYDDSPLDGGSIFSVRKQPGWAMTSGACGSFTGQEGVWNFTTGWEAKLTSTHSRHSSIILSAIQPSRWWDLVPDTGSVLVTAGRGTQDTTGTQFNSGTSYVTAAKTADGALAWIYLPNAASAITVSWSTMAASNRLATWVDPTNGAQVTAAEATSYSRSANAAGGSDWLLKLTAG